MNFDLDSGTLQKVVTGRQFKYQFFREAA
ncbi:hypothetical protein PM8797T_25546 [Gimesia maris DSM 8797]|nr:hypothetical protein PM8797T_25546 [Gimesia maris DSM 8797]